MYAMNIQNGVIGLLLYQNWSVIVLRVYSVKNALWAFFSPTEKLLFIVISAKIDIKEQSLELSL
jgi:hypothetical protein